MATQTTIAFAALALVMGVGASTSTTADAQERAPQFAEPPAGSYSASTFQISVHGAMESVDGALVSTEFFSAARVRPMLGRLFIEIEYRTEGAPAAVLSYDLWQRLFQGSPQAIGSAIQVNGRRTTIVGIAERGFRVPTGAALWVPKVSAGRSGPPLG